jgi:hypothetical protein
VPDVSFQYLWHRIIISSEDSELLAAAGSRFGAPTHRFEPVLESMFTIDRLGAEVTLHDGPDLMGTFRTTAALLDQLAHRLSLRAAEFASLKGWVRYRGMVCHDRAGHARLLIAGPGSAAPQAVVLVGPDRSVLEVPHLDRTVAGHEGPASLEPLDTLFVVELTDEPPRVERLSPLAATECLIESSIVVTEWRGVIASAAAGLVSGVEAFCVRASSYEEAASVVATLVVDPKVR